MTYSKQRSGVVLVILSIWSNGWALMSSASSTSGVKTRSPSAPLSDVEVAEYEETGVVVVRQLLSGELLKKVLAVKEEVAASMATSEFANVAFGAYTQHDALEELALRSTMTAAARQLMVKKDIHLLLDAFFKLQGANRGCGWHVDDQVFWPVRREDDDGINIWVALDPCDAQNGGGLAVAPGTHSAEYDDVRDTIRKVVNGQPQTCSLAELNPEHNARIEANRLIPTMQPGDAILHRRFIFHRTVPFTNGRGSVARFSARYVPSNVVLKGFTLNPDPDEPPVAPLPEVRIDAANIPGKFLPCY